ncbi:MAG TPA: SDR family oxidoreductase [Candidatus Dormibacteraeota bacterium]|nr:SDR family oxidoreductase [Candidatus Dormibacteraeota bacterium]
MSSQHWDEARADAYARFRYDFPERTLAGKTVVVAGGTGGLGAATVSLLLREGAHLIVGYRKGRERAASLSKAMAEQYGANLELIEGDIASSEVRGKYIESCQRAGASLAGVAIFPGDPARVAFEKLDRDALLASLEVNYVGPVLLAKDLGQVMEGSSAGGSVVLLTTMQAYAAFPGSLNYGAPKAALAHAAKILAQQWNRVRVNVVAPGATISGMAAASVQSGKYDRYVENGAIGRFGRAEDVARAVRFFLEPDNYITGQTLVVDGGLTLRRDRG